MRYTLLLLLLVMFATAACGGAPAASAEVAQPSADAPVISPDVYLEHYAESDHVLVDVRTPGEVASGVIPGAVSIPLDQLAARTAELPADKPVIIYCNSGNRSREAASILKQAGYDQMLDLGGVQQWRRAGQQLVALGS